MKNWIVMLFMAAAVAPWVLADDVSDCKAYFSAKDYTQTFSSCSRAAEQGDAKAQYYLGWMYLNGEGVPKDRSEAMKWFRLAAEQEYAKAQYHLGLMYSTGDSVLEDKSESLKWIKLAAEQGDIMAQFYLGTIYNSHNSGVLDKSESAKWFRLAAEQGFEWAQFFLGTMYYHGQGVLEDKRESAKWYRLAAEQGVGLAQFDLGTMYYIGEGVLEDKSEAAKWFRLAAAQGDTKAQRNLGVMYYKGEGVLKSKRVAKKWFRLAAEQGNSEAQNNLGWMYDTGEGVIQDEQEAYIWYLLAAEKGDVNAIKGRDLAAMRLDSDVQMYAQEKAKKRQQEIKSRIARQFKKDIPLSQVLRVAATPDIDLNPAAIAFENSWRSVVVIETNAGKYGSGVIIRPNVVATNCHVIEDGTPIKVFKANEWRAQKDEVFYAQNFHTDKERDFCLLTVADLNGVSAYIRLADSLRVGEAVYAIGAPEGFDYSLSAGVISQLRWESKHVPPIQTDAAVSPGSSGGGLFDAEGNLVGITTSKRLGENVEGINFAIPADWLLETEQQKN